MTDLLICKAAAHSHCLLQLKIFQDRFRKAVVVVVLCRNIVGAGDYGGIGVCHGDRAPGSFQHGNIVFGVPCRDTLGERNAEMPADEADGIALSGGLVKDFQILAVGKDRGNRIAVARSNDVPQLFQLRVVV